MAVKAVIFDCFGVLVTSARKALKNDYPQYIDEIDNLDHQADYGLISRDEYNEALSRVIGLPNGRIETKYWGGSIRLQGAFDWVKLLKQDGYKIGLLSNVGLGFFNSYFSDEERNELFDAVILSSETGIAKPDRAIYEMMADALGVRTDECVMIDDTPLNVEAAQNVGMQGIWFITIQQAQNELSKILGDNNA